MQTRIIIGANAYCNIRTESVNIDILLSPGKGAKASLLETAQEWRDKAIRLMRNAELAEEAARTFDPDQSIAQQ